MIKQDVIQNVLSSKTNIIKHGILNEKILLELKMNTSFYDYIEVVTNYYDDEERPDFNNWTDVEGMGYGWAWLKYENEEHKWYKMMCKMVASQCEYLNKDINNTYYLVYEDEINKYYHFINFNGYREDTITTLSNKEIW